jgi:hypothetical protein
VDTAERLTELALRVSDELNEGGARHRGRATISTVTPCYDGLGSALHP